MYPSDIDIQLSAPTFHCLSQDKAAVEGEDICLEYTIHSVSESWSVWDKDGHIILPSKRIVTRDATYLKSLHIEKATANDAGIYRLTVENTFGCISATTRLTVLSMKADQRIAHITIKRHLMTNWVQDKKQIVLTSTYRSLSSRKPRFFLNGNEISTSVRRQKVTRRQFSALVIDNIKSEDFGTYYCSMENSYGYNTGPNMQTTIIKETLSDNIVEPPIIIRHLPKQITRAEGSKINLNLAIKCQIPFVYVWLRNNKIIQDSLEFRYADHGHGVLELQINDSFVMDSAIYACVVHSIGGKCISKCSVKIIEEKTCNILNVPQILNFPQSYTIPSGGSIVVCAHVIPTFCKVIWSLCGIDIDLLTNTMATTKSDGIHTLYLSNLNIKHNGEIRCTANLLSNNGITATASTFLSIVPTKNYQQNNEHIKPTFLTAFEDQVVLNGQNLVLESFFCGKPDPHVLWLRAGRPIDDKNVITTSMPGYSSLLVQNINANQSGKYSIQIINSIGSEILSASVAVEGPPDPPSGTPLVTITENNVHITWCGPHYDGGCMILGFILEMQSEDNEWSEVATILDSLGYTFSNMIPAKTYRFRVRAKNIHGCSDPGAPSANVTLPVCNTNNIVASNNDFSIRCCEDFKSKYELMEELGRGRFGVVYKARDIESNHVYAAKLIKCIKMVDKTKVREEIAIMKSLQHAKLLHLYECFEGSRETVMIVEFISGGELFERVVADDFTLTEKDCVIFIRQICEGVQYMHNLRIVHLDLKPENIMCKTRSSHEIKIIDFGLAQRLSPDTSVRVLLGTAEFVPPEIINYEPIGLQSDMWSIGVICYVLLSGLSPFMGENDVDTFNNITGAEYDFDDDAFQIVTNEAKDFISGLLQYRKEDRLSPTQCLHTKWLSLDNDYLGKSKICTNKLKKFIIRRKWQKTGNAIRALGRMALLSASRRNSSVLPTEDQNNHHNE
uniref:Myosin light chain kinase, smooth muscle n=2 Tax=Culex pipiens TaxID=7175 RepID=A0A8D7ZZ73_CULPI